MTRSERILVAMVTYNERENLPPLVDEVEQCVAEADLLIVDDNSPDGTGRWVDGRSAGDPRLVGLHRPRKLGIGTATVDALRYAVDHDYTYVVALDADGSHDPKHIPEMLDRIRSENSPRPDVVIGSRYVAGGGTAHWPIYRRVMSRTVNVAARVLFGLPVHDCSGAFRCIRVDFLRRVDLNAIRSEGYSFFEESLWHFQRAGARFDEIPIVFANRKRGSSKINVREACSSLWMLVRLGFHNRTGI